MYIAIVQTAHSKRPLDGSCFEFVPQNDSLLDGEKIVLRFLLPLRNAYAHKDID